LINEDFAGEGSPPDPQRGEIYYERRNGVLEVAYPVFVDGTEIPTSGYLREVNRRAELGRLILQSEYFPTSLVNRYWAHFFGYGFTRPFDDMGPHNPPSHPELLRYLGDEFRASGFDLKQLIRWVTLSEAYSLSSRPVAGNRRDEPLNGETPRFTHFYVRQMRAEELYHSLLTAATVAGPVRFGIWE
jgi:hypothetical protein